MLPKYLLAVVGLPSVLACALHTRGNNSNPDVPPTILGPDTPSDPETTGYFVNHFALNVNNLNRSMEFYADVFGMRHMFTYHLSTHISVTYMSHSQGGRNSSGYQTTDEMLRYKNNNGGHIEFLYMNTPGKDIPRPEQATSTFNHIGIIVPDVEAVQRRLEKHCATIYKKAGEPMPREGPLADPGYLGDASHLSNEEFKEFQKSMDQLNQLNCFAADPDENLLEILPLDEPDLFG